MIQELLTSVVLTVDDIFTDIIERDWAAIGGWSLFILFCVYIVFGAVFEWWVPGRRYRRLEIAAEKISEANTELTKQNGQLITANEITKHFFEETAPKRGEEKT